MSTGFELYKRWKTAKGFTSDNAARVRLGVTRAAISSWKNGHYSPSAATVELMAKDLGEDPRGYVLKVESERASSPTFGKILAEAAKKFPPFAATLLLALFGHDGNCKQLQVYTKPHFTYVTSYYPKASQLYALACKVLRSIFRNLMAKVVWDIHRAVNPLAA